MVKIFDFFLTLNQYSLNIKGLGFRVYDIHLTLGAT
jgi:hypothetical protein